MPHVVKYLLIVLLALPLTTVADTATKLIGRDRILSAGEEWQEKYDSYAPEPSQVNALKSKLGKGLRIDIYLGLWCSDSKNNVPPFLKILDAAESAVPVRYFNVWRKPVKQIRYFVDSVQVERVPTFIFYRDEVEIGRIVENPEAGLIEDTIAILSR